MPPSERMNGNVSSRPVSGFVSSAIAAGPRLGRMDDQLARHQVVGPCRSSRDEQQAEKKCKANVHDHLRCQLVVVDSPHTRSRDQGFTDGDPQVALYPTGVVLDRGSSRFSRKRLDVQRKEPIGNELRPRSRSRFFFLVIRQRLRSRQRLGRRRIFHDQKRSLVAPLSR